MQGSRGVHGGLTGKDRTPTASQFLHWYVRSHATHGMKKEIQSMIPQDFRAWRVLAAERINVRRILSLGETPSSGFHGYTSRSFNCVSDIARR